MFDILMENTFKGRIVVKDGYIRVAALTPKIKVGDCVYNAEQIKKLIKAAYLNDTAVAVFPELCITGYTCNDLFLQDTLLGEAMEALRDIRDYTCDYKGMLVMIGLPYMYHGKLYNVAAAVMNGHILGLVPKQYIPNYGEFYERRQFFEGFSSNVVVDIDGDRVAFGGSIIYSFDNYSKLKVAVEICEDLWTPQPPSIRHALNGATLIVNASASNETIGKAAYRREIVKGQSARLVCGYVYASSGDGESTQDIVFGAHNIISENGSVLAEARKFANESIYADIDMDRICSERRRMSTFVVDEDANAKEGYTYVRCPELMTRELKLRRFFDKAPFVPDDKYERAARCEEILDIQTYGLKKRLEHTGCRSAVIGISGGLDSTLALLVIVRAFDLLGLDRKGINCITMPCFGTTDRTYSNAVKMSEKLGASLREINIRKSVKQHFEDIGHDEAVHDITYENGQARERTQILMDIANQTNGMVIGTGDMSELALGWATYNGDHMSMYGVNASVPKTLVRHLVSYYADTCGNKELSEVLYDVLDTPVSPELLPPNEDGTIQQKTEDLVGPYELHDFFMYHILRFGVGPEKLFRIAKLAFAGEYDDKTIYKWLRTFVWRFFSQQFKRSCLPDGPKVGSVAVSPRGDLRMPSDASSAAWIRKLDKLKESIMED